MQLLSKLFIFQVIWLLLQQSVKISGKHYQTSMFLENESTTATDQVFLLLLQQQSLFPSVAFLGAHVKNLKVQKQLLRICVF